ncbi:MAG: pyruvate kinase [Candidatus Omnitrophica bacterium]|nr:pyruvate kinase [Candidatus Omnitrophota bacterium]MCF7876928.1 pyruvate kinase [Candidatus Omnitrophota bacterium]MCF7878608.1 pyruvate kinase [Candidatus Omnitrophota bacterium]MCF7893071.1 pyruvate kinase [Candidatus Omnitrophota bacterium]
MSKAKIISTLGPASRDKATISKMASQGMDVVRLNFSHGSRESHLRKIKIISELNRKRKKKIRVMQDLEGYRIRVGRLKNKKIILKNNSIVYLSQEDIVGNQRIIPFDYKGPLGGIKKENAVYIDDGKIVIKIQTIGRKRIKGKVIRGGAVWEKKGINIVGAELDFDPITEKDKKDLESTRGCQIDYIAQSFVRSKKDLLILKQLLKSQKRTPKVFAKVESLSGLANIDELIDEADGIIVARGDLGICLPIYKVPYFQKKILEKTKKVQRLSVVATQMLESMTKNMIPTRAEVSDVANAILDGADFLLFSGETAIGKYPVEVVKIARKIIAYTSRGQPKDLFK